MSWLQTMTITTDHHNWMIILSSITTLETRVEKSVSYIESVQETYFILQATAIELVLGVKQNPSSRRTPQVSNELQGFWQLLVLQKSTLFVAERQTVPGAARQVFSPLKTVHAPPQRLPIRLEQYVTIVASVARGESGFIGSPTKVRLALVLASQWNISSWETK